MYYVYCTPQDGTLQLFYFYDGENSDPSCCLLLDDNGGLYFPTMFRC